MHKMLRNVTEKLKAKLPATTHSYSVVKFACFNDSLSEYFELEASAEEGQSLKRRKRKVEKNLKKKNKKPDSLGHFLILKLFFSVHAQAKMSENMMLVERKACCRVANAVDCS